jgi:hypothetical protein
MVKLATNLSDVEDNGEVIITFDAESEENAQEGSWIGLYPIGVESEKYSCFVYTNNQLSGQVSLYIESNGVYGPHELRYFSGDSVYLPLATVSINVTPFTTFPVHITTSVNTIEDEHPFTISWDAKEQKNARKGAWIGIYPAGEAPRNFKVFYYTGDHVSGSIEAHIDANGIYGPWEIKYFASSTSYTSLADTSITVTPRDNHHPVELQVDKTTITSGDSIIVSYSTSDPNNVREGAWIGAFPENEDSEKWKIFAYVEGVLEGLVTLEINTETTGPWEIRFFPSEHSKTPKGTIKIHVDPLPPMHLSSNVTRVEEGEFFEVSWDAVVPGNAREGSWISLYHPENHSQPNYPTLDELSGTALLAIDANGLFGGWEIRYFNSHDATEPRASIPIVVLPSTHTMPVTISLDKQTVKQGETLVVSIDAGDERNARNGAWIGVFRSDVESKDWDIFQYTDDVVKGDIEVVVNTSETGEFEVRYFPSENSLVPSATATVIIEKDESRPPVELLVNTPTIVSGESVSVTWNANDKINAANASWIGIFSEHSRSSKEFEVFDYTGDLVAGSIEIELYGTPGLYFAKYFSGDQELASAAVKIVPHH